MDGKKGWELYEPEETNVTPDVDFEIDRDIKDGSTTERLSKEATLISNNGAELDISKSEIVLIDPDKEPLAEELKRKSPIPMNEEEVLEAAKKAHAKGRKSNLDMKRPPKRPWINKHVPKKFERKIPRTLVEEALFTLWREMDPEVKKRHWIEVETRYPGYFQSYKVYERMMKGIYISKQREAMAANLASLAGELIHAKKKMITEMANNAVLKAKGLLEQ